MPALLAQALIRTVSKKSRIVKPDFGGKMAGKIALRSSAHRQANKRPQFRCRKIIRLNWESREPREESQHVLTALRRSGQGAADEVTVLRHGPGQHSEMD